VGEILSGLWAMTMHWVKKRFAGAWMGAVVTALILVAGLLGSLYTAEARNALKTQLPLVDNYGPALVVCVLSLSAALFFLRQYALDAVRQEEQSRLESATRTLETIVRTQPPVEFQHTLGVYFEKAMVAIDRAQTPEEIISSIAIVVEGLAALAQLYDHGPANDSYGVNVMIFVEPSEGAEWFTHVRFLEEGVALPNLAGLLALCPQFSAHKGGGEAAASPDPAMSAFALPVPRNPGTSKENKGDGWRVLPGAPRAFVHGSFEHFCPTSGLTEWCEKHGDFNHYVVTQITKYFSSATGIGGFCSMPLYRPREDFQPAAAREVIAVLNVHWSGGGLLVQHHAAKAFGEAVFPIRALLARQLVHLFAVGKKPGPPVAT
jgi:hypothetical protein